MAVENEELQEEKIDWRRIYAIVVTAILLLASLAVIIPVTSNMQGSLIEGFEPVYEHLGLSNVNDMEISKKEWIIYMGTWEYVHRFSLVNDSFLEPIQLNSTPDSGVLGALDISILNNGWGVPLFAGQFPGSVVKYKDENEIGNYTSDEFETSNARFTRVEECRENDRVFLGTDNLGFGFVYYYNRNVTFRNDTHGLPHNQITRLKVKGNYLIVGTSGGFAIYDILNDEVVSHSEDDEGGRLQVISIDYYHATQTVFVGNRDGLFIFKQNGDSFEQVGTRINSHSETPLPDDEVHSLELDVENTRLYIGTQGGISYIDLADGTQVRPLLWGYDFEFRTIKTIRKGPLDRYLYLGTTLDYDMRSPGSIIRIPIDSDRQFGAITGITYSAGAGLFAMIPILWTVDYLRTRKKKGPYSIEELKRMLVDGESRKVEFKETLLCDVQTGKENEALSKACFKTIAAFMNTCGGVLFIGVTDKGEPVGLERDLSLLQKKAKREIDTMDQFEIRFEAMFKKYRINEEFRPLVLAAPRIISGVTVYVVQIQQADRYVYLTKKDEFYFREKKGSRPLKHRDIQDIWESRNRYCN
jgi:hypothetical protein